MKNMFLISLISSMFFGSCVQNGKLEESGNVEKVNDIKALELPHSTNITYEQKDVKNIEVLVTKTLDFFGHPPKSITKESLRRYMGCAYLINDHKMTIATYGEWNTKEGGANISLKVIVPKNINVTQRDSLSGDESIANSKHMFIDKDGDDYWYNSIEPDSGWTKIDTKRLN